MQEKLHALFNEQIEKCECFGGAAAVIKDGEVVFKEYFGDDRFNDNSIFRLASVTKIFTAVCVMKLHEDGKINIYDNVSKYIPAFSRLSLGDIAPNGMVYSVSMPSREITLFDLLTHTAGLGADSVGNREYTVMPIEEKISLASVTEYYGKNFHLAFEPGSKAAYSGFAGYDVLARVVEIVSEKSFNDFLQDELCIPLGLRDTTFQPTEEQYLRLVPMHQRAGGVDKEVNFKGTLFRGMPRTYELAGASLISSLDDVIRFCKMILSGGEGILKKETIDRMMSPALEEGLCGLEKGENNGIGCFMISGQHRLPKGIVFSHGAYGTHIIFDREKNFAAIFLKNSMFDMSITSNSTVAFEKAVLK